MLANSKAAGIGNGCHKLWPSEIRAHRGKHYRSSDSEAFTKPSLQHAASLTSLHLGESANHAAGHQCNICQPKRRVKQHLQRLYL